MLPLFWNNRGFSLIEAMIALLVTMVAVMAIFSLVAPSWRTSTQSDEMGRAAHILYDQLQKEEIHILNPSNTIDAGAKEDATVFASGLPESDAKNKGDIPYVISTTITQVGASSDNRWSIRVRVTWNNGNRFIEDELTVVSLASFRFS